MIEVVYACGTERVILPSGQSANVCKGQHWPSTDQVVQLRPDLFVDDPRYGLVYTEAPPGYDIQLAELPETDDVESATAAPGERRSARRR